MCKFHWIVFFFVSSFITITNILFASSSSFRVECFLHIFIHCISKTYKQIDYHIYKCINSKVFGKSRIREHKWMKRKQNEDGKKWNTREKEKASEKWKETKLYVPNGQYWNELKTQIPFIGVCLFSWTIFSLVAFCVDFPSLFFQWIQTKNKILNDENDGFIVYNYSSLLFYTHTHAHMEERPNEEKSSKHIHTHRRTFT